MSWLWNRHVTSSLTFSVSVTSVTFMMIFVKDESTNLRFMGKVGLCHRLPRWHSFSLINFTLNKTWEGRCCNCKILIVCTVIWNNLLSNDDHYMVSQPRRPRFCHTKFHKISHSLKKSYCWGHIDTYIDTGMNTHTKRTWNYQPHFPYLIQEIGYKFNFNNNLWIYQPWRQSNNNTTQIFARCLWFSIIFCLHC